MECLDKILKVLEGSKVWVDVDVVGDVVAIVLAGRGVDGREPHRTNTQVSQVVNLRLHTWKKGRRTW